MKVLPILNQYQHINNNINTKKENNIKTIPAFKSYLSGVPKSYISFSGGNSLDLYKTFGLLHDKEERDGVEQEPYLVRREILNELEKRNPDGKTLIDIHKQVYGKLLFANDLDEIKSMYPTFRLVKNFEEVDFKDNKFIAEIKNGNNAIFNNKEDLSVQLIKLYWGEGFSLSDIAKQANVKPATISAVMEKLNIERVTPYYGKLLKLSDKEYNERFTREMAEKMELIASQKRGEPYIPRKPLTKEQKQHISESLIKFYSEHPERIVEMSERQKEFFKKHPEYALVFRFVMFKAWNMESCAGIRKKLEDFLKRNKISLEKNEFMTNSLYLSKLQSEKMKAFWEQHPYEKKKFGKAVEQAWKKINNYKDIELIKCCADAPLFPKEVEADIVKWTKRYNEVQKFSPKDKRINLDVSDFHPSIGLQLFPMDVLNNTKEYKVINEYFKHNKYQFNKFNDAISFQILGLHNYYKRNNDTEIGRQISSYIEQMMQNRAKMDVNVVVKLYAQVLQYVKESGNMNEYSKILKAYDLIYGKGFDDGVHILCNM